MVQVEFVQFQNQASESKLEFARPKKNTNVCSNYLVCKQTISNASLKIILK